MGKGKQHLKIFISVLLILTLLPIGNVALANQSSPFKDVSTSSWAFQHVFKMEKRGVITGYGNGEFRPNKTVSQLEAVVMAVRAMGLEEDSKTIDTDVVDEWGLQLPGSWGAPQYVAMAIEKGLIEKENFDPNLSATRAWIAVLVIKMIGAEAEIDNSATTDFVDDAYILNRAKGYVALASDKGIVTGFYDSNNNLKFDPNTSVTRAQLATMISRSDKYMTDMKGQLPTGKITKIDGNELSLMFENGQSQIYELASNVLIFNLAGEKKDSTALTTDLVIRYSLNNQQKIDFMEFLEAEQWQDPNTKVSGTITQLFTEDNLLTIRDDEGNLNVYHYGDTVTISNLSSDELKESDIEVGNQAELTLDEENQITRIHLSSEQFSDKTGGEIYSIDLKNKIITLTNNQAYKAYQLADQVTVENESLQFPTIRDLVKGDQIEIQLENNLVVAIKVIQPVQETHITGKIITLSAEDNVITVKLADGSLGAYQVSDDAEIIIVGKDPAYFEDLKVDDMLEFQVEDQLVTQAKVTNREVVGEITGTVKSVDKTNYYLTIETKDSELKTFVVDPKVKVDGDNTLSDIDVDMRVTLELNENVIYAISTNTTAEGIFDHIDIFETYLTIKNSDDKRETYRLDNDVRVNIHGETNEDLSDIEDGQALVLRLDKDIVIAIDVKTTKSYTLKDVNTSRKRITITKNNKDYLYSVYTGTDITVPNVSEPTIADLEEGQIVNITFIGNFLAEIEVVPPTYGMVKRNEPFRDLLVVTTNDGEQSIDLAGDVDVYNSNSVKMTVGNLDEGDYVKIVYVDDQVNITQAEKVDAQYIAANDDNGRIYVKDEYENYKFYDLSKQVVVEKNGVQSYLGDLEKDDQITLYLFNELIYFIEIQ